MPSERARHGEHDGHLGERVVLGCEERVAPAFFGALCQRRPRREVRRVACDDAEPEWFLSDA
jgi:hypothetical protein